MLTSTLRRQIRKAKRELKTVTKLSSKLTFVTSFYYRCFSSVATLIWQSESTQAAGLFSDLLWNSSRVLKGGQPQSSHVALKSLLGPVLQTTQMSFQRSRFYIEWFWVFFLNRPFSSLSGSVVAAAFCSLFCSIVAQCALCDSHNETRLGCFSTSRLNFCLHGSFVRDSHTVLGHSHYTVEMQRDFLFSACTFSSPSFHINVNVFLGIGTGLHVSSGSQTASGEIRVF